MEQEREMPRVKVVGKWGYGDENESAGYFVAGIKRMGRFFVVRGLLKAEDNTTTGKFFGIIKRCFFNGMVKCKNKSIPVVGLVRLNRENHAILMRWMSPRENGWATGRILQNETWE